MTEDETVGWHHRHNGHGFGWTLGVGDGQGGLACCGSWGRKESDTTERLNWTECRNAICTWEGRLKVLTAQRSLGRCCFSVLGRGAFVWL